jgi:hypothetical protein
MRKSCFLLCLCICCTLYAQQLDSTADTGLLEGIWENQSRILIFRNSIVSGGAPEDNEALFILKPYYGLYYDIASVYPFAGSDVTIPQYHNAATGANLPEIRVSLVSGVNGSFILSLTYPGESPVSIPAAVIGDTLYLDFYVRSSNKSDTFEGFWKPASNVRSIALYKPQVAAEISGYYVTSSKTYRIRYWQTDAPYEDVLATLTDDGSVYEVDKYIRIDSMVYTCVHGLRTQIRNLEVTDLPSLTMNADWNLFAIGDGYLFKTGMNETALAQLVIETNAKVKPPRKSEIEYLDLDFHYDEIERIRSK